MRSRVLSIVAAVAVGVGGLTLGSARPAQAAPTVVPDPAFAACLNGYLGNFATAPITAAQLAGLAGWVECRNASISSLEGAQYLTGLGGLSVYGNQVSDASPVADLTGLLSLDLGANRVNDLTPLAGLTHLNWLNLPFNEIVDLTPLAGLTGLAQLLLGDNSIRDLAPLAGLTSLTYLDLSYNRIFDVAPLAGLTRLSQLLLVSNTIADLSPLSGLLALKGENALFAWDQSQYLGTPAGLPATLPVVAPSWMGTLQWTVLSGSAVVTGGQVIMPTPGTAILAWSSVGAPPTFAGTLLVTTGPVAMYRLFNPTTGEHFYTANVTEATINVAANGWVSEGIGWFMQPSGEPVYRLRATPGTGSAGHLFTTSLVERNRALATGQWDDEGIGWWSDGPVSVFRQYDPSTGQHNYTSDANEIAVITTQQGWVEELVVDGQATPAWLGIAPGDPGDQTVNNAVKDYRG